MRIILLLLIVLTAFSLKSYSQPENDSLLYELNLSAGIEKIDILNDLADNRKLTDTETARYYAQQAAAMADSLDYDKGKGYAMQILSYIAYLYGDFDTAISNDQESLNIAGKLNDPELKKRVFEVLALVYEETNAYDKSLLYFQYAYEQNGILNNPVGMGLALMGAGRVYEKMTQYEVALRSNLQSRVIFKGLDNNVGVAKSSLAIAKNYFHLDMPDSVSYFFSQAENIIKNISSTELLLDLYLEKIEIYAESHIDSSLFYIRKAIILAESLGRYYLKRDLLLETSEFYSMRGEYQLAYDFHQEYSHLNDSLLDLREGLSPGSLDLSLNDAIYSEQQTGTGGFTGFRLNGSGRRRGLLIGFGIIIISLSASLVWLLFRYKVQRKFLNKIVFLQNEIKNLSSEIIQKEKLIVHLKGNKKSRTAETNGTEAADVPDELTEKEGSENIGADFLKGALNTFISNEWRKLNKARKELGIDIAELKLEHIKKEDWIPVNLNALTLSIIKLNQKDIGNRIQIHHNPDPAINLHCHPGSILLLVHNLFRNSIESIEEQGDIFIDYFSDVDKITYRIIDTGRGIAAADLDAIFQPFFSTRKSDKHLGLGLTVSRDIVMSHHAIMRIKSKPGSATEVLLEFYYS